MWVTLISILLVIYFLYQNARRPNLYPPGPISWPFIGNLISVWLKRRSMKYYHAVWQDWSQQYGDVLGLKLGHMKVVIVSGKDMIREVASREVFDGRPEGFSFMMRSLGKKLGIVFSDGDLWSSTRRVVQKYLKTFGYGTRSMELMITQECEELVHLISENIGNPILVNKMFDVSVINILWQLVAGKRYDLKDKTVKRLADLISGTFKSVDMSGGILNFLPSLRYIFPGLTGYNEMKFFNDSLYEFISGVIKEHQRTINVKKPRDVIDAFLIEMMEHGKSNCTEEHLQVVCLDLLEAGSETVKGTLIFIMLYIVLNEDVQRRLHQEIDQVIGQSRLPNLSDRNRMKYTEAVILEGLRMSSIAPVGIAHMALEDARLKDYIIPKGTLVLMLIYDLHNGRHWVNPEMFSPERFLNKDGEVQDDNLMIFGFGKRRCIGEGLARSELFLFLTHLLQKFHIQIPNGDPTPNVDPIDGISLSAQNYRVIFKTRQ